MIDQKDESRIDEILDATRAEYRDEECLAAEEEKREAVADHVFSVRLYADLHASVKEIATKKHLTPSALIRQWVAERAAAERMQRMSGSAEPSDELREVVASLTRDVEHLRTLMHTTPSL